MAGNASSVTVSLFGRDVSLSKTLAEASGITATTAGQITTHSSRIKSALTTAFSALSSTGIGGEYAEALGHLGEGIDNLGEKHANFAGKVATGGAVVGAAGLAMTALASKDSAAQQQLSAAITATGGSYSDYKEEIEKTVGSQEKFGHTADQTQQSLQILTAATGNPTTAIEKMGLASDLAASQHISLQDASSKVARILGGSGGRTLAQYGITMGHSGDKTADAKKAAEELAEKLSGQASAASDTFSGKIDAGKAKLEDFANKMGGKVGPALAVIGPALGIVSAAMELFGPAATVAAVGETEMGVAADAAAPGILAMSLPILAIIAVIALLVVGIYELVKHWHTVWDAIRTATMAVWHGVIEPFFHFLFHVFIKPLIIEIHSLEAVWKAVWNGIKDAFDIVWGALKSAFGAIKSAMSDIGSGVSKLGAIWSQIWHGIQQEVGTAVSFIVTMFRHIADIWLDTVGTILHGAASAFGWVPGVGGKLKQASAAFDQFHSDVDNKLSGVANSVANWGSTAGQGYANSFNAAAAQIWVPKPGTAAGTARQASINRKGERAAGGPVGPNDLYLVGEEGPEWFVSDRAGTILPHGQSPAPTHIGQMSNVQGDAGSQVLEVHLHQHLDGKQIAESTHRILLEKKSRGTQLRLA